MKKQFPHSARFLILIFFTLSLTSNAQHWRTTGNGLIPVVDAPTAASFVGTTIAVPLNLKTTLNQPMNFFTNNTQRAVIDGTTGFVGIGQSFLTPQNLLHLNMATNTSTFAQFTNSGTGSTSSDGFLVGATGGFLNGWAMLNQQEAQPMWFLTGGTGKAIILANGNTGIGTNFISPAHLLDVRQGDINTGNGTPQSPTGYMIGDNYVLWHNSYIEDILVGVGAGNGSMSGHLNTFVGHNAGLGNTSGTDNTFVGNKAGLNNNSGSDNTFVGKDAGTNNLSANQNTFIGKSSGLNTTTGFANTVMGYEALRDNLIGGGNTAVGWRALWHNAGYNNTAVGSEAMMLNTTADQNTAVGVEALRNNLTGAQNVAIGYVSLRQNHSDENTAVGCSTLVFNVNGTRNTALGDDVLSGNDGNSNTGIGSEALTSNATGSYNTAIGDNALRFTGTGDANTASGYWAG